MFKILKRNLPRDLIWFYINQTIIISLLVLCKSDFMYHTENLTTNTVIICNRYILLSISEHLTDFYHYQYGTYVYFPCIYLRCL